MPPPPPSHDAGAGTPVPSPDPVAGPVPNPPEASVKRSSLVPVLIVAGVVVVLALVAAALLSRGDGGGTIPDELAGQPRIDSGPLAEVFDALDEMEVGGVSFDLGVYGTETQPRYMVMLVEGDIPEGEAQSLLSTLPAGIVGNGQAEIDFSQAVTDEVDGVEYLCAPAAATSAGGQAMTMCMYQGDGTVGMVMAFSQESLSRMLEVTKEVAQG